MIPKRGQMTIYDLKQLKGKRQVSMVITTEPWVAKAAQAAGIDIVSTWADTYEVLLPRVEAIRRAAPNVLLDVTIPFHLSAISDEEAARGAVSILRAGGDMVYPGLPPERVAPLAARGIPCHCHIGLVPMNSTWTGGLRGYGKTSEEALKVYQDALTYEAAGAAMLEIECVPASVAAEISRRVGIPVISCGSGSGCDGQLLFSDDILGTHNHLPRHAKKYRDLATEATSALKEFNDEVKQKAFPPEDKLVRIKKEEYDRFIAGLQQ